MAIFSFFRSQNPRRFNYVPMYYDAEKEAIEKKINRIKAKYQHPEASGDKYVPGITRGVMRSYFKSPKSQNKRSNMRLAVILLALLLLSYYLFFGLNV